MKDYLRYTIYADEPGEDIDYRSSKKEAIKRAYELVHKYGALSVINGKTGEIVFETHPKFW